MSILTRKCSVCQAVTIQSDRITCSRCSDFTVSELTEEEEDPYYEEYLKKPDELFEDEEEED